MAQQPPSPREGGALTSPPSTPPSLTASSSQDLGEPSSTNTHIPYSHAFADALMKRLLSRPAPSSTSSRRSASSTNRQNVKEDGIRVIPPGSGESPTRGASIRLQDVNLADLPDIAVDELPLPLDDARRIYASGVPGVRLTHPGGWLEGGVGPSPLSLVLSATTRSSSESGGGGALGGDAPDFVRSFIEQYEISTPASLRTQINAEIATQTVDLKNCMRQRRDAIERNEKLRRDIEYLVAERDMERRVHERQMKVRKEKMAEREKGNYKMQTG